MKGIELTEKEGMVKNSVVKLNYIFTISEMMVKKKLLSISKDKKELVREEFFSKIK